MSELTPAPARRRRADAERSAAAVLDAAARLLGQRPDAGVEDIAALAGVSRQTVYAHFPSRERLIHAVVDRVTAETVAAIDAARLDEGPAAEALLRFLDSTWRIFERYPLLPQAIRPDPTEDPGRHASILDRLGKLVQRGQRSGEFDREQSSEWLLVSTIALAHAAGGEVGAGRMQSADALADLRRSMLKLYGAQPISR